jgi:nitrite reductase/ring-hydroxylating ferredoxin subunit
LDTMDSPVRKWTELENVRQYFLLFKAHKDEFHEYDYVCPYHRILRNAVVSETKVIC